MEFCNRLSDYEKSLILSPKFLEQIKKDLDSLDIIPEDQKQRYFDMVEIIDKKFFEENKDLCSCINHLSELVEDIQINKKIQISDYYKLFLNLLDDRFNLKQNIRKNFEELGGNVLGVSRNKGIIAIQGCKDKKDFLEKVPEPLILFVRYKEIH